MANTQKSKIAHIPTKLSALPELSIHRNISFTHQSAESSDNLPLKCEKIKLNLYTLTETNPTMTTNLNATFLVVSKN
jgi:hypothetical protein